jgi:phosphatidylglycerophosphate synthase
MTWYNIPNILSLSRIVFLPVLFLLAWHDMRWVFLGAYIILALTDFFDGFLARRLKQETELGKRLDSLGDLLFYLATALFAWWLFPEYIRPNLIPLYIALGMVALSLIVSMLTTGKPIMLHTMTAKVGAFAAGATLVLAFFINATALVATTLVIYMIAFLESIVIFLKHGEVDPDVRSVFHVKRRR